MEENLIVDMTEKLMSALCDPQTVNNAKDTEWKAPLWEALVESGLTLGLAPGEKGGAGISLTDGFAILRTAGKFAVPVPLAETMLAGWLLAEGDVEVPQAAMTVAPQRERDRIELKGDGTLEGAARKIAFAPEVDQIAVLAYRGETAVVALVNASDCSIASKPTMAKDAAGDVSFSGVTPIAVGDTPVDQESFRTVAAVAYSALMAGSLEAILDISVGYVKERIAFGRPLAKFQAVQQSLATLGCEAAAAASTVASAADTLERFDDYREQAVLLEAAAAKIRVGEAATAGAAIAHQAHGAIGFTVEYVLNRFTRRMWVWRDQFGSESEWALKLGNMICKNGADEMWPLVASR